MNNFPYRIVLASGSPRRKQLLTGLDLPFTIEYNSEAQEIINPKLAPEAVAEDLARQKSYSFLRPLAPDELLITADTLVYCRGQILGKPHSRDEALAMLGCLSGQVHTVFTGVHLRTTTQERSFTARTQVTFDQLSISEIAYYVDKYQPYDKAGAYGAQDWIGYVGIKHIEGSYFNVMGLPVHRLFRELQNFD
jgi:MAF protein